MAKFIYNNAKNTSTSHTPFKLNYGYHPRVFYKEDVDPRSKSKSAKKPSTELRKLMIIFQKNLYHTQKHQKRAQDKAVKLRSYASDDKVWLNNKYIKTKLNYKLKVKFFGPFQVLYSVGKQAYKLKLSKKQKIHNVFHVSQLEQYITRKVQVDETMSKL